MRTVHLIIFFVAYSYKVDSFLICESDFCVCRHNKSDQDLLGVVVDCANYQDLLTRNYSLPNTAYTLDLARNNLAKVPRSRLLESETLVELFLNRNQITEITPDAFRLTNLKKLDLSGNKLEVIYEGTFNHINKLEYLNLANNKFASFEKLTFHHLGDLKEIILDNNNLGPSLQDNNLFDRDGYGLTHKIQSLSISGIGLDNVHDNFFVDAFDLKRLIISNNTLSDTFEIPFTLEYLDLSNNPIPQICEEDFADLVALKVLKLNNLMIKEVLPYTFASLHALTHLELERNKNLVKFSATAFGREVLDDADDFVLENLSLKGSRLTTLDQQLEVPFGQLIRLDLQGNFWHCDCNLKWIKKLQIHPEDYDHLRCYTPYPLYNSRVFDLQEKYFTCGKTRRHVIITITVICFSVLLISLAIWMFVCATKSRTRCHEFATNLYTSAGYSMLPVNAALRDPL